MNLPDQTITIIGRGHSGTRAISRTLAESGVYMGAQLNESSDLVPAQALYDACRVMARHVRHLGNNRWDFSALATMPIPEEFTCLVRDYLASVLDADTPWRGWKLPETTLIYPWITRLFPNIRYIYWIRDPRDSILSGHLTDDLSDFGIDYERTDDLRLRRATSWLYQSEIIKATAKPEHFFPIRFEDFVLRQEETITRLETWLGIPLHRIPVRPEAVGRWKNDPAPSDFPLFAAELKEWGYASWSSSSCG